jgi:hypothetical protein
MRAPLTAALATACLLAVAIDGSWANMPRPGEDLGWSPRRNADLGFAYEVPARLFEPLAEDPTESLAPRTTRRAGVAFRSVDGQAHFQVAAFENVDQVSPAALMRRIAQESYKDAAITFSRLGNTFFILSGNRRGEEFYERVTFSCLGRLITVWHMNYPVRDRALYDRVVETVARSFRPASGGPECD